MPGGIGRKISVYLQSLALCIIVDSRLSRPAGYNRYQVTSTFNMSCEIKKCQYDVLTSETRLAIDGYVCRVFDLDVTAMVKTGRYMQRV
jgi:hypothetical protein